MLGARERVDSSTMPCDLDRIFAHLAVRVPETEESCLALSAETLPRPPSAMNTDRLVIEKRYHAYNDSFRVDALHVYASKATYCHLGLLAAAVLFSPAGTEVTLAFDHPASNIRRLILRNDGIATTPGFHSQPLVLNYYPSETDKHPWVHAFERDVWRLPGFFLTNADESIGRESDWATRDTVVGFGTDEGTARLVELLLNASRPSSRVDEFELECECGFRGVAPGSCEVRLWLPGSFGWQHL